LAAALALVSLLGCKRETRSFDQPPAPGPVASLTQLHIGEAAQASRDARGRAFEKNAYRISEGSRLYRWYNCSGCHFNGGGGIGPALMDKDWRYGGSIEQIYSTIYEGRPNGMPSFAKVPPEQIWELAAYVRSLSANTPPNAVASRRDATTSIPPRNQVSPERPRPGDKPAPVPQ
jgi:cytochrome c oxidase cbb3-type subunit 3